jgi:predicted unusual protein kinase regulating ubiquinone biosynthesis (AarF/ABC1/UbiB family)
MQRGKYSRTLRIAALAAQSQWRRLLGKKSDAFVAERLGQLRGLPQKVGQILALNEITTGQSDYRSLAEGKGELSFTEVQLIVEEELGGSLEEFFADFAQEGIGASLSQVHRARTKAGHDVVVKVQYPGIEEAIEADLYALGWLSAPVGNLRKGFDLTAYQHHVHEILIGELDYRAEAENLRAYAASLGGLTDLAWVPEPLEDLSTGRVLTMSYKTGQSIEEVAQVWDASRRESTAENLLRLFAHGLLHSGLLHGDPHPGNIRFIFAAGQSQVVLYDFGCLYRLAPERCNALCYLIRAADDDSLDPWDGYMALGFDGALLDAIRPRLSVVNQLLFAPFLARAPFVLADWNLGERLQELLGEERMVLRLAGPADLLLLMRGFQGLLQYLKLLKIPLNWHAVTTPYWRDSVVPVSSVDTVRSDEAELDLSLVEFLCVRVVRDGEQRVQLRFPARALVRLPELIPPDGVALLEKQGRSAQGLLDDLARGPVPPQEIFVYGGDDMQVRIWVE